MRRARLGVARRVAHELLQQAQIAQPPVPVRRLARMVGAEVHLAPYQGELAGSAIRTPQGMIIGVNAGQPATRQRFTIAHEIGHLLLHPGRPLLLDEKLRVSRRDERSSMATDVEEMEANQFAAELLMPEVFVRRDVETSLPLDIETEIFIAELARRYAVSPQAMTIRLTALGYLR